MYLSIDVRRRPYSFIADAPPGAEVRLKPGTWHESLLTYVGGDPRARDAIESQMRSLAEQAGTTLNYDVYTQWQPVESQRTLLWAARQGKQEEFMSALSKRHFTERKSASERSTILEAAEEAGLDVGALDAWLDTDELADEVWKTYGETIHVHHIHSIPYFVFNHDGPAKYTNGGPWGDGSEGAVMHQGSGSNEQFYRLLLAMVDAELRAANGAGQGAEADVAPSI